MNGRVRGDRMLLISYSKMYLFGEKGAHRGYSTRIKYHLKFVHLSTFAYSTADRFCELGLTLMMSPLLFSISVCVCADICNFR